MFLLKGPMKLPLQGGKPRKIVIFAHGYGSNGDDLLSLAPYFAKLFPDTLFIAPHAPEPVPGHPGGYQWFALSRMEPVALAQGVTSAAGIFDRYIDQLLAHYQLSARDLALIGFSQGAMMALYVGLRRKEAVGAILGYSGSLAVPPPEFLNAPPPVALIHGDRDDVIPFEAMFHAVSVLADHQVPSLWRLCPGAGHTITEAGLDLGVSFLRDAFLGKFSSWAPPQSRPQQHKNKRG